MDFKGKKAAVVGMGVEGISSAKFLAGKGARVTIFDSNKELYIPKQVRDDRNIEIKLGKDYLKHLSNYDIIVRSPGIKPNLPVLVEAEKKGVIITSQTKIFFDLCPCPIIGVTGTKGKGTTASLIYEMLKAQNLDAYLGGNIGVPPLDFLDKLTPSSWVVLELSSFQLLDLTFQSQRTPVGLLNLSQTATSEVNFGKPHIAVMLMVVPEHLNYHKDVYEYVEAKRNILKFQTASDFAILNRDYPAANESDIHTEGQIYKISTESPVKKGCFINEGKVVIRDFTKIQNSKFKIQNSDTKIIDTRDILLPGKHNLENVCASVMTATLAGVSKANIVKVLKTFKGLEHRLELVGEVKGVKYYDDSFSTTPETAIAAIAAFKQPEILILGGSSKGSDFTELGRVIRDAKNVKAIIGIGEEWRKIKSKINEGNNKIFKRSHLALQGATLGAIQIYEGLKDMREVVRKAAEIAKPGDVVLLSPACASFGMFKNYKDRGEQFRREVKGLISK